MILVSRREDMLRNTLDGLEANKLEAIGLPIARTTPLKADIPPATHGLILTSSAAVKAAKGSEIPCYCVGPKTARAAENAGLKVVFIGNKGGQSLAEDIASKFPPQALCHLTTAEAGTKWYTILKEAGFSIKTRYGYETTYLDTLPDKVVCCLRENKVSSLLVFSAVGAEKTCELLNNAGFAPDTLPQAVAISENVARALEKAGVPLENIQVARNPTSEDIINVLEQPPVPTARHT